MRNLLVLLIALLLALPALGRDWMLIYGSGQAPCRSVLYADISSLRSHPDHPQRLEMTVVEVFESSEQPDTVELRLLLDSQDGACHRIFEACRWRDGKTETSVFSPEPYQAFWSKEALSFALDRPAWRSPYQALLAASASQDQFTAQAEFLARGYMLVRGRPDAAELSALTWETAWADSTASSPVTEARRIDISALERDSAQKWATYWLSKTPASERVPRP